MITSNNQKEPPVLPKVPEVLITIMHGSWAV